jgi:hypothetical protein
MFHDYHRQDKMAVEFFSRRDFYSVLKYKYRSVIKEILDFIDGKGVFVVNVGYLEMLLASDMTMSELSKKEKIQLMGMALERMKYVSSRHDKSGSCQLMIAIMKSCKYKPFVKDIEPRLFEATYGYVMTEPDGEILTNVLDNHHVDMIVKYAKRFLNEQK